MNNDLISRGWLEDAFDNLCCHNCKECRNFRIEGCSVYRCALIDNAPTEKADNYARGYQDGIRTVLAERPGWIPITYRPMTEEEEKERAAELGIAVVSLNYWEKRIFTCQLPDDGQEILISWCKYVKEDICVWDEYGCGLEENGDWDGVAAWMPKPEPYDPEGGKA